MFATALNTAVKKACSFIAIERSSVRPYLKIIRAGNWSTSPFYLTYSGEVSRREKMTLRGTDPESYINEYTLVYED